MAKLKVGNGLHFATTFAKAAWGELWRLVLIAGVLLALFQIALVILARHYDIH